MIVTCCQCGNHFSEADGDIEERMCDECFYGEEWCTCEDAFFDSCHYCTDCGKLEEMEWLRQNDPAEYRDRLDSLYYDAKVDERILKNKDSEL